MVKEDFESDYEGEKVSSFQLYEGENDVYEPVRKKAAKKKAGKMKVCNYACDQCEYTVRFSAGLKLHLEEVHQVTEVDVRDYRVSRPLKNKKVNILYTIY